MPKYDVNAAAFEFAKDLIERRRYVLRSDWGERQPQAADQNRFLKTHDWTEYGQWHLGLTEGPSDDTKARYAFAFGDFRRIHRTGIIAVHFRAAEWRHKDVELAAHELLQILDRRAGIA
jgi:hypothetical protein